MSLWLRLWCPVGCLIVACTAPPPPETAEVVIPQGEYERIVLPLPASTGDGECFSFEDDRPRGCFPGVRSIAGDVQEREKDAFRIVRVTSDMEHPVMLLLHVAGACHHYLCPIDIQCLAQKGSFERCAIYTACCVATLGQ